MVGKIATEVARVHGAMLARGYGSRWGLYLEAYPHLEMLDLGLSAMVADTKAYVARRRAELKKELRKYKK